MVKNETLNRELGWQMPCSGSFESFSGKKREGIRRHRICSFHGEGLGASETEYLKAGHEPSRKS